MAAQDTQAQVAANVKESNLLQKSLGHLKGGLVPERLGLPRKTKKKHG